MDWSTTFAFGIWILWQHRNRIVFQNQSPNQSIHKEVMKRATEFALCAQLVLANRTRVERRIKWERPLRGWYKLNTDGSSLGNPGAAGGGGVIRDASGAWIQAFSRNICSTTSFLVELWALRNGLIMCKELQLHAVEVELDACVVSDLMNHNGGSNSVNSSLVADCRLLIAQMPQVKVNHCYREANCCA